MSLDVDLGEFLSAYLAEAEEHVAAANARLLVLERASAGGAADPRALRDLFRTLHTLKGLSAMVGVDPIVAVSHAMESLVRAADRTGAALAAPAVEALFRGQRAIEERLAALARGEKAAVVPQAVIAELDAAPRPRARVDPEARQALALEGAVANKLAPFEREQLLAAGSRGKRAVRVDFVPSPRRAAEGLTITTVRERLAAVAEIVKVVPVAAAVTDDAPGGLRFVLLLVTDADDASIGASAGREPSDVVLLAGAADDDAHASDPSVADVAYARAEAEKDVDADDVAGRRILGRTVLRVDVARVDDALERLALLLVTRSRLARAVADLAAKGLPTRELSAIVLETTRQLRDMRAAILGLRMVPFAEVLARLPLVVRGLQRASGKEVRLVVDANDAELDKSVAERVFPALVHLVRNAVDHGIEPAAERLRRSKPPHGTIRVACTMATNRQLVVRVADDGGGVDREALVRASGQPIEPTGAAILEVLCRPGVSTRREATATSGRGMGMDIVQKIVVSELGGELALDTTEGAGTIFTLRIPLTVAVLDAFTVRCEGEIFAVPVGSVEEIVEIDPSRVVRGPAKGGGQIALLARRGEAVPLVHLLRALGRAPRTELDADARQALVVRRGGEAVAFQLDRVLGQQETVVRPLVDPLVQTPGVAGSADLGDGRATLVLDLPALVAQSAKEEAAP